MIVLILLLDLMKSKYFCLVQSYRLIILDRELIIEEWRVTTSRQSIKGALFF